MKQKPSATTVAADSSTAPSIPMVPAGLPTTPSISQRSIKPAAQMKVQASLNACVLIDRTGSSDQFRIGIPRTVEIIFDQASARAQAVHVTVWTGGDEDYGEQPILHTDRGTVEQALSDVGALRYGGGGDADESHLSSIERVVEATAWSDERRTRNALIAIVNANTKPAKSGRSAREIGKDLKKRNIFLCLVCEPYPLFDELVEAAGGLQFVISNDPSAEELQKVSSRVAASIVASLSAGGTMPMGGV